MLAALLFRIFLRMCRTAYYCTPRVTGFGLHVQRPRLDVRRIQLLERILPTKERDFKRYRGKGAIHLSAVRRLPGSVVTLFPEASKPVGCHSVTAWDISVWCLVNLEVSRFLSSGTPTCFAVFFSIDRCTRRTITNNHQNLYTGLHRHFFHGNQNNRAD